jgi:hypothetical protein
MLKENFAFMPHPRGKWRDMERRNRGRFGSDVTAHSSCERNHFAYCFDLSMKIYVMYLYLQSI